MADLDEAASLLRRSLRVVEACECPGAFWRRGPSGLSSQIRAWLRAKPTKAVSHERRPFRLLAGGVSAKKGE